eukprot:s4802_g2.t1
MSSLRNISSGGIALHFHTIIQEKLQSRLVGCSGRSTAQQGLQRHSEDPAVSEAVHVPYEELTAGQHGIAARWRSGRKGGLDRHVAESAVWLSSLEAAASHDCPRADLLPCSCEDILRGFRRDRLAGEVAAMDCLNLRGGFLQAFDAKAAQWGYFQHQQAAGGLGTARSNRRDCAACSTE